MAFVKVAQVSDLDASPLIEVLIDGNPYAVCRLNGEVHALDGVCPHQGGPLGQGMLTNTGIMCPWHAYEFDCRTGANDIEPDEKVRVYPVKIEGRDILVDVA